MSSKYEAISESQNAITESSKIKDISWKNYTIHCCSLHFNLNFLHKNKFFTFQFQIFTVIFTVPIGLKLVKSTFGSYSRKRDFVSKEWIAETFNTGINMGVDSKMQKETQVSNCETNIHQGQDSCRSSCMYHFLISVTNLFI